MDKSTLDKLIERSVRNDENAFRKIVEEYQYMVYSLSFRLLGNEEEAKDAVQETFIKVWLRLHTYDVNQKFSTWLYAVSTNLCIDKLKKSKSTIQNTAIDEKILNLCTTENSDQKLLNSELGDIIQTLTNELSPKQKTVFTLSYFEELETNEISRITGLTPEKVKSNLYLARQAIQKKLEKY